MNFLTMFSYDTLALSLIVFAALRGTYRLVVLLHAQTAPSSHPDAISVPVSTNAQQQ